MTGLFGFSALQGRPVILCSKEDTESSKFAYKTIELPQTVDCLQGVLSVIPLQLLSFHLAVLRGYDVSILYLGTPIKALKQTRLDISHFFKLLTG